MPARSRVAIWLGKTNMLETRSNIIKNKAVVANDWALLRLDAGEDAASINVPAGKVIVPLEVWLAQRESLQQRPELGVWLASDARPEVLSFDLAHFAVIAVDFPKFTDGRGYSVSYNLRARLGFTGELRAIGDVLRDQLFYMQRVGFDAFEVRADKDIHNALKGLSDFSETYQHSLDQKSPLFRRAQRGASTGNSQFGDGLGI